MVWQWIMGCLKKRRPDFLSIWRIGKGCFKRKRIVNGKELFFPLKVDE